VPDAQAAFLAGGAGLRGWPAKYWVDANRSNPLATITEAQRERLFLEIWDGYTAMARHLATGAGSVQITLERWNSLHPVVVDLLTDLRYSGAYRRIDEINSVLANPNLDTIGQLRELRTVIANLPDKQQRAGGRLQRVRHIDEMIARLEEIEQGSTKYCPLP
jgi:hypothetical protein